MRLSIAGFFVLLALFNCSDPEPPLAAEVELASCTGPGGAGGSTASSSVASAGGASVSSVASSAASTATAASSVAASSSSGAGGGPASDLFAWEYFAYPVGSNLDAATCPAGTCGGWRSNWILQHFSTRHTTIVADFATLPAGLTSLGNAAKFPSDSSDASRTGRTISTGPTSLACAAPENLCGGGLDAAGDPMLFNGVWYIGAVVASTVVDTSSIYGSAHLYQDPTSDFTKATEKLQLFGADNLQTTLVLDRTTQGTAEGSNWHSSIAFNTTPHLIIVKVENQVAETSCSGSAPGHDNNGATVNCTNMPLEAATMWVDALTEGATPAIARKVVANWTNGKGLNAIVFGGTESIVVSHLCAGFTFAAARCDQ